VKKPGLSGKLNEEELKRLLASEPKLEAKEEPEVNLSKVFDPFRYS
jgi:hypothetical protein